MNLNFEKYADRLIPAVIQDEETRAVLMLGFMNDAALKATETTGKVTFYSRARQKLWTKGETSGNFFEVRSILPDCDNDTLLIKVKPNGAACHTGAATCFDEENAHADFLFELEKIIGERKNQPPETSYTAKLFAKGLNKIAQKVGEEAVELVIEAKDSDAELFKSEAADLLYHLMVLLAYKDINLSDILQALKARRR